MLITKDVLKKKGISEMELSNDGKIKVFCEDCLLIRHGIDGELVCTHESNVLVSSKDDTPIKRSHVYNIYKISPMDLNRRNDCKNFRKGKLLLVNS